MDTYAAPRSKKHESDDLLIRSMKQGDDCVFSEQRLPTSKNWNMEKQINFTGPRSLGLQFLNNISESVFTGVPLKGEDYKPLMVALFDDYSGEIVTFGPEAFAKLEIVVLESGEYLGYNWTAEEFKNWIVTNEGNKQLITGNVNLDLKEGIGFVDSIRFCHTKTWKKKRAYRLGAMAKDDYIGTKIREGITKSFFVKDHRLDLNKKHYPPSLSSEVWRLDGIARDGAFHQRLRDANVNINTVEDLLKKMNTDPQTLRDILGKGMSAKMWEIVMNHARTCILDEKMHSYSFFGPDQKTCVVFNVVGQVMGLFLEFEYVSFEMLSESGKAHAMNLMVSAFQQWDKVISFDEKASLFNNYMKPNDVGHYLKCSSMESSGSTEISTPPRDDGLHLPKPAICFDYNASFFGKSPSLNNIVHPQKFPSMETFDLSEVEFLSPLIDELDFLRPAVSYNDEVSLFDKPPSTSNNIFHPKSPNKEISSGTKILITQKNDYIDFPGPAFSFDDDNVVFVESPSASNTIFHTESPNKESSNGCKIIMNPEIADLDIFQPVVPSQEIIPNFDSIWEMNYYNDYNWQIIDSIGYTHENNLRITSEMTHSNSWDAKSMIWPGDDFLLDNPQNDRIGALMSHTTTNSITNVRKRFLRNKAKRNWRVLFSLMRWLSVCRKNVAEEFPVEQLQLKRSFRYQNLKTLGSVRDFAIPTSYKTEEFVTFSSHAPILSRNLSMKSEDSLYDAVNDILLARSIAITSKITPKRYMSKREKSRRRWRKLYSVMRWFSVQRNVTKRKDQSCSSSLNNLSAIWDIDKTSNDSFLSSWDMCLNQQSYMSFSGSFHEDKYVQLFDTFCSLEPRIDKLEEEM